ncbi:hypothetical protein IWQ62_004963 [Dispira parvispora]|uniref:Coatomer subunit epsilon n=1 Tax=Dispira parvispora TaxID=1520584 RepID=A0A9W8E4Y4_9FUNG|nr:hypothetical protein IWQ62_004963 [Dispira parvispora]
MSSDAFVALYNLYHYGAYQAVVDQISPQPDAFLDPNTLSLQWLLYRAYLAQGKYTDVLDSLSASAGTTSLPAELEALRLLALVQEYQHQHQLPSRAEVLLSGKGLPTEAVGTQQLPVELLDPTERDLVEQLKSFMDDATHQGISQAVVPVASAFYCLGQLEDALQILAAFPKDLECLSLTIQILLTLQRTDLARKEVAKVKSWAEDDPLALLMEAWVNLRVGGPKYREALYTFEELAQAAPTPTVKLLVGQAACHLHLGHLPEAESLLLEALSIDDSDPDALANMVVCSELLQKPTTESGRYLDQLRQATPSHPLVCSVDEKSQLFDECLATLGS